MLPALLTWWPGSFTCYSGSTGLKRIPNKSQHRKLILQKKILLPLLLGMEFATLRPQVRSSTIKNILKNLWCSGKRERWVCFLLRVWQVNSELNNRAGRKWSFLFFLLFLSGNVVWSFWKRRSDWGGVFESAEVLEAENQARTEWSSQDSWKMRDETWHDGNAQKRSRKPLSDKEEIKCLQNEVDSFIWRWSRMHCPAWVFLQCVQKKILCKVAGGGEGEFPQSEVSEVKAFICC